ncbi:MAG: TlpA disulfide reductase family protein, partial [Bacteroidota bacterium]
DRYRPFMNYARYYGYYTNKEPNIDSSFYRPVKELDLNSLSNLSFKENLNDIKSWYTKDVDFSNYATVELYYDAQKEALQKVFENGLLADYYTYLQLTEQVNFGRGIDKSQKDIEAFKNYVKNPVLLSLLDQNNKPWEPLRFGKKAPYFTARTIDEKTTAFSDLQGKRLYIDVWATWCKPCIREIPALKKLEEDLSEEPVQFVSISIDKDKDKQKWKDFVKNKELGGIQLIVDGDWKSDFAISYKVSGIPRFMIIDSDGTIINANAPRPSDPAVKDALLN